MKICRQDCLIIGGMRGVHGRAGFDRAPVVVECQGQRYIAPPITQAEFIEGEPMSDEEWLGVLASGEALEFSRRHPAAPNASLWLMRKNFSFRDQAMDALEGRGAVLHKEGREDALILLVDELAASRLLDEWSGRAWNQAWVDATLERLEQAVKHAELAMCLARGLLEDHVAFLSVLYARQGDMDRAEAILELGRNSRGEAFFERACEKKARFARELTSMVPPLGPRFGPKMAPRRDRTVNRSFGRIDERDAA